MTRTRRLLLDLPAVLGLGVAAVAVATFVEARRVLHTGLVAQVAAVEEVAARQEQRERLALASRLQVAAEAAKDTVVRQLLAAPAGGDELQALMQRLAAGWPVVEVAIERANPLSSASDTDAVQAARRFRWPVVDSVPELGEVVVAVDDSVVERLAAMQAQTVAGTVAAIERAGAETGWRLQLGLLLGTGLALGLAWWGGACRRRRAPVAIADQTARVAQVAAAQAEFLAMISHELRTPINAVLGASELLRTTALDAEQAELVAASDLSGRQLLSLVDGLLDLADLERGSLHVTTQVFDLELELEGAWQMFVQAATDKGLALELDVDAHLPDVVLGDAARLREVLAALLGNAIKFTAQGEVRIAARGVGADAAALRIEITDTGEGLDPAQQAAVFRRFEPQHGGRARRAGGAGVGLTIASALVQRMGGRIGVRSERARGSTFWFELPNRRPSELQRREFEAALPLRGRRLLLLTGSEELAARVTGQLLSQGCEVSLFSPARASDLAAAPDLGWDCVVADVDVALRLGETLRQQSLPAVVLGNRRELRDGEFVRLPVRKSDLLQAVLRACERFGRRMAAAGGVRRRVLVAEDNAVNRRMVEKMLEVAGCEVVLTADGDEAVRAFRDGYFELVLMDYQMPGLDGPQAARRIRALPGGADVPIVAFTANSSGDVRDACSAAGMNGFLCKPLRFADLEQVLARWAPGAAQVDAVRGVGEGASA